MNPRPSPIIDAAIDIASKVPPAVVEQLAALIESNQQSDLRSQIGESLPHAEYRSHAIRLLDDWRSQAWQATGSEVAIALRTAGRFERLRVQSQKVEMVWTGPHSEAVFYRHTEQAILQVLDSSAEKVLLASYAVYSIPNIQDAVVRAADRGVAIRVIVETPNKIDVTNEYSTLRALGTKVAACSRVYYWPKENRGTNEKGKHGIFHVKCLVADGKMLFLSSANLTEYAFSLNMELGLLVSGGRAPKQIQAHFERLMEEGVLQEV